MAECWIWLFRLDMLTFSTAGASSPISSPRVPLYCDLMLSVPRVPFAFPSCLNPSLHKDHFPETEMLLLQKLQNIQYINDLTGCFLELKQDLLFTETFFSLLLQHSFSIPKTFLCHIKMCAFFLPFVYGLERKHVL